MPQGRRANQSRSAVFFVEVSIALLATLTHLSVPASAFEFDLDGPSRPCPTIAGRAAAVHVEVPVVKDQCRSPTCGLFATNGVLQTAVKHSLGVDVNIAETPTYLRRMVERAKQGLATVQSEADVDKISTLYAGRLLNRGDLEQGGGLADYLVHYAVFGAYPASAFPSDLLDATWDRGQFTWKLTLPMRSYVAERKKIMSEIQGAGRLGAEHRARIKAASELEEFFASFLKRHARIDEQGRFEYQGKWMTPQEFADEYVFQRGKIKIKGASSIGWSLIGAAEAEYRKIYEANTFYRGSDLRVLELDEKFGRGRHILPDLQMPANPEEMMKIFHGALSKGRTVYLGVKWHGGLEPAVEDRDDPSFHAVELVAIDPSDSKPLTIKNSYGSSWRNQGFESYGAQQVFDNLREFYFLAE